VDYSFSYFLENEVYRRVPKDMYLACPLSLRHLEYYAHLLICASFYMRYGVEQGSPGHSTINCRFLANNPQGFSGNDNFAALFQFLESLVETKTQAG
jgi:hypothetical protein